MRRKKLEKRIREQTFELAEEEKWNAVVQCNSNYDGVFFYGVKTTGIVCKPSCKSKEPKRNNVMFFDNIEDAYTYGLRPCKRCRPDLIKFNPMKDLIKKAKDIFDKYYANREELELEIKKLGISQNYLIQLFRKKYGLTPVKYLNQLRIEKSLDLLSNTSSNITDIALRSGFESLSTFYDFFKKQIGMTPKEYRKNKN